MLNIRSRNTFADPVQFAKKLLESAGFPGSYNRMALYVFVAWVHSMSPAEVALKMCLNPTHCDSMVSSATPDRDRKKRGRELRKTRRRRRFL